MPADFVFRLTAEEAEGCQRSRSQIATLKRGLNIKYLPYAFGPLHAAIQFHVNGLPLELRIRRSQSRDRPFREPEVSLPFPCSWSGSTGMGSSRRDLYTAIDQI